MNAKPLLAALVPLVLGCASEHQIVEFTPLVDYDAPRRDAAEIAERSAEELSAEGYQQIGLITITRVISVCYETCKRVDHQQDTATLLLQEAGKRGGELVILDRHNEEFTRDVSKEGDCLEHYTHHQTSPLFVPTYAGDQGAVISEPQSTATEPVQICTHFEILHGHEVFAESSGSVWARD